MHDDGYILTGTQYSPQC